MEFHGHLGFQAFEDYYDCSFDHYDHYDTYDVHDDCYYECCPFLPLIFLNCYGYYPT